MRLTSILDWPPFKTLFPTETYLRLQISNLDLEISLPLKLTFPKAPLSSVPIQAEGHTYELSSLMIPSNQ